MGENVRMRDATEKDFEKCLPLLIQLWPGWQEDEVVGEQQVTDKVRRVFSRLLENPKAKIIVVEDGEQIIGLIDLTFRETLFHRGLSMIIEDVIVHEAYRRRGFGQKLVRSAEDIARQYGCHAVELNSELHRKETHQFWESLGYDRKAYQFRKRIH